MQQEALIHSSKSTHNNQQSLSAGRAGSSVVITRMDGHCVLGFATASRSLSIQIQNLCQLYKCPSDKTTNWAQPVCLCTHAKRLHTHIEDPKPYDPNFLFLLSHTTLLCRVLQTHKRRAYSPSSSCLMDGGCYIKEEIFSIKMVCQAVTARMHA